MHAFWASRPVTPQQVQSLEDEVELDVEVPHVQSVSLKRRESKQMCSSLRGGRGETGYVQEISGKIKRCVQTLTQHLHLNDTSA